MDGARLFHSFSLTSVISAANTVACTFVTLQNHAMGMHAILLPPFPGSGKDRYRRYFLSLFPEFRSIRQIPAPDPESPLTNFVPL